MFYYMESEQQRPKTGRSRLQRLKQGSCESQQSSFDAEPVSFSASWRDRFELDVEDALWNIGFGVGDLDPIKRVPIRFLHQMSKVAGNDISNILRSSSSGSCWCQCHNNTTSVENSSMDARSIPSSLQDIDVNSSLLDVGNSTILNPVNRQFFEQFFCRQTQNRQLSFITAISPSPTQSPAAATATAVSSMYPVFSPMQKQAHPSSNAPEKPAAAAFNVTLDLDDGLAAAYSGSGFSGNNNTGNQRTSTPAISSSVDLGKTVDHRLRMMQRKLTKLSNVENCEELMQKSQQIQPGSDIFAQKLEKFGLSSRSVSIEEPMGAISGGLLNDSAATIERMGHSFTSDSSGFAEAEGDSPRIVSPADIQRIDSTGTSNSDTVTIRAFSPHRESSSVMLDDSASVTGSTNRDKNKRPSQESTSIAPLLVVSGSRPSTSFAFSPGCSNPVIVYPGTTNPLVRFNRNCATFYRYKRDEEVDPKSKSLSGLETDFTSTSASAKSATAIAASRLRRASESCLYDRTLNGRHRAVSDPLVGSEIEDYLSSTMVENEMAKLRNVLNRCQDQLKHLEVQNLSNFRRLEPILSFGTRLNMETVHVTALDALNEVRSLIRMIEFRTRWTLSTDERKSRIKALSTVAGLSLEQLSDTARTASYTARIPWARKESNYATSSVSSFNANQPKTSDCQCNSVLQEMQNLKTFLLESQRAMHIQLAEALVKVTT